VWEDPRTVPPAAVIIITQFSEFLLDLAGLAQDSMEEKA
jgi:hypothetical protein